MNVHHLELFYYVAKYEGITPAVRRMPYGIQQPAVSGQMLNLERSLGTPLFHRRPFVLTAAGEQLYNYVYPFFSRMEEVRSQVCGEGTDHLRLAAPTSVLANHLPGVLGQLRKEYPALRLTLRELPAPGAESALLKQEADIAVTLCDEKVSASVQIEKLIQLPLILLVQKGNKKYSPRSFQELEKKAKDGDYRIDQPLVSLLPGETVARLFQKGLEDRSLIWNPAVEVTTLELVMSYVAQGFGYGLSVAMPQMKLPANVISQPLDKFPSLEIGLMHTGKLQPVGERFIEIVRTYTNQMMEK
ncbi:MAG: LysR family transcriptional regulator [Verrucomicrobiota bacterium]